MPAPGITTVETVGAGGTFQAAMLTYLAETGRLTPDALASMDADELARIFAFTASAAAITCSCRGADMPRRAKIAAS